MAVEADPFEALELWRRAQIASVRGGGSDLSVRRLSVLITVYMTPPPR